MGNRPGSKKTFSYLDFSFQFTAYVVISLIMYFFLSVHPKLIKNNFVEWMAQDKDEGAESCRRRIPVVSFSIGATGTFVFNKKQTMEGASSVDLESGDVLVFGGPSRMIYHGVREIVPDTMPSVIADQGKMRKGRLNLTFRQFVA